MEILVNFTNPMLISKGQIDDQVLCNIKNRFLFMSNLTGKVLAKDSLELINAFPKQLPKGVVEVDLVKDASSAGNTMKVMMFVQLVA